MNNKKLISAFAFSLAMLLLFLPLSASAKEFVIQNESVNMFVVNGTSGYTILNPNFGKVGIGTTSPGLSLTVIGNVSFSGNLSVGGNLSVDGSTFFVDAENNRVGIGLTLPNDALEVVGNVRISGSLNASFINASRIFVGTTPVQVSGDFDLRNITNNTIGRAELDNGTVIRTGNLTTLNTLDNYIRTKDFRLENVSNYTNKLTNRSDAIFNNLNATYLNGTDVALLNKSIDLSGYVLTIGAPFSNFRLENVSNYTTDLSFNNSISYWNITSVNLPTVNLFPKNINTTLLLGLGINTTMNWSDSLAVIGSVRVNGSLFATFINASEIRQGSNKVQTVESAYNNANNATNYTVDYPNIDLNTLDDFNVANNISNNTIGRAELDNGSVIRTGNLTTLNTLDNYIRVADFNLGNVSNATVTKGDNVTSALWNKTGNTIYPRVIGNLIGIGTPTPDNILTILGDEITANAILHLNATDNYNRSVTNVMTLDHVLKSPVNVSGGIGVSILFRASDNASQMYKIGNISAILTNTSNGTQAGALTFSTTAGSDTGDGAFGHLAERMRIDGSGNIGIGTTSPASKMEVAGTFNATSSSTQFLVNSNGDVVINLKG